MWGRAPVLPVMLVLAGCSSTADFRYPADVDPGPTPAVTPALDNGTGEDGPLTVSAPLVVNTCASVSTASGDAVSLGDPFAPVEGTRLLLLQVSDEFATLGASVAPIELPGNAGLFELARAAGVSGDVLSLEAPLAHEYVSNGAGIAAQVCTVLELTDLTVSAAGELHAVPWDGRTGGVVAVLATGEVLVDGAVRADGAGFRGGLSSQAGEATPVTSLSTTAEDGGGKAEGLDGSSWLRYGRGALASAAGGGNSSRAGGGGGGGGGAGGTGGTDTTSASDTQGSGGAGFELSLDTRAAFGGGGGGGHQIAAGGERGGAGGAGGGFVLIFAESITGSGAVSASGSAGADGGFVVADGADGAGGGGAGGTILLDAAESSAFAGSVSANGANGGDVRNASAELAGPGGGGGGGRVRLRGVSATRSVDPGIAGANLDQGNDAHGATAGAAGIEDDS